jgi:thiamine-phosphate pyrophosphorylase
MSEFVRGLERYLSPDELELIGNERIGIAGAGGLGSNCAQSLVRMGFRKFIIADFDTVDASNLNRQFFFYDQIGQMKTEALKTNLLRINEDLEVETVNRELDERNLAGFFASCSVVVEAFDTIACKKMFLETLGNSGTYLVCSSGLGHRGTSDSIRTRRISDSLCLVGDGRNCLDLGAVPLSPGVTVAAAKQAGAVLNHVLRDPVGRTFIMPDLYALTYSECSAGRDTVEVVKEMIKGGIKLIQYREKEKSMIEKYRECREIRKLTADAGVFFIINDHIDLALMVGADGIHLGQDDIPLREARNLVGDEMIIGLSTHSPEQGLRAVSEGADYIGVGPIFSTKTKKNVCDPVGFEYLEWVVENLDIPFVAIGGIKKHNLDEIVKRGAKTISLVSEITGNENIPSLIRELNTIIEENRK